MAGGKRRGFFAPDARAGAREVCCGISTNFLRRFAGKTGPKRPLRRARPRRSKSNKTPHEHWFFQHPCGVFSSCASRSRTCDGGVKVPCLTAWRWRIASSTMAHFGRPQGLSARAERAVLPAPSAHFATQDSIPLLSRSVNRKPAQAGITAALLPFWKSPAAPLFLRPAHQKYRRISTRNPPVSLL